MPNEQVDLRAMWTMPEAFSFLRELTQFARPAGWFFGLTGGVLITGQSRHDIDIIAIPLDATHADTKALHDCLVRFGLVRRRTSEEMQAHWREKGLADTKHVEEWEGLFGGRIDLIVYETNTQPAAEPTSLDWTAGKAVQFLDKFRSVLAVLGWVADLTSTTLFSGKSTVSTLEVTLTPATGTAPEYAIGYARQALRDYGLTCAQESPQYTRELYTPENDPTQPQMIAGLNEVWLTSEGQRVQFTMLDRNPKHLES